LAKGRYHTPFLKLSFIAASTSFLLADSAYLALTELLERDGWRKV